MEPVKSLKLLTNNKEALDGLLGEMWDGANVSEEKKAGEVFVVSAEREDGAVDVLITFPTKRKVEGYNDYDYKPAGLVIDLATLLNVGRLLAIHHGAVLQGPSEDEPEAYTDDNAKAIMLTKPPGG